MNRRSAAQPSAGFGLVETMVALVIGLLATFIIMQIFASSEGQKRTITGGADAQSDAAVALYLIERDVRQAGYGFSPNLEDFVPTDPIGVLTNGILAQCTTVHAYNAKRSTFTDYVSSTFAPVVINPPNIPAGVGDANTDVVLVNYGGAGGMIGKGIAFTGKPGATEPDFVVTGSRTGFSQGDMFLAVPKSGSPDACTIGEITGFADTTCPVGGTDSGSISHGAGDYKSVYAGSSGCGTVTPAWNDPDPGVTYDSSGSNSSKLYNLGPVDKFVSRVYAVRKGNLTMCDLTTNDCTASPVNDSAWTPIAAGVVGLKALYGKDTDSNGAIDAWNATQPTGVARAQVVALRLALAVRSGQYEKEEVTTVAPVWLADAPGTPATIDLFDTITSPPANWKHYRYKAAQSLVPLRNLIWGQQK